MALEGELDDLMVAPADQPGGGALAQKRRYGIRAATLTNIRWIAVAGQLVTVLIVQFWFGFDLPLIACLLVIMAGVWFNVIATMFLPVNARLSETAALCWLMFDAVQLAVLLSLCGGLSNPFCILFLATTTITAAALTPVSVRIAVLTCVTLIVLVELVHLPLTRQNGEDMLLPFIYRLGFGCSLVIGIAFIAGYIGRIADESFRMSQALAATQLALSREHQLSSLGAMAAAAAHELGTPLATIAVTAREMQRDLPEGADKEGDLALIREQTARCRDILAELAGIQHRDAAQFQRAPLLSVLEEAAAPHLHAGKDVIFIVNGEAVENRAVMTPEIDRRPEIIHSLRNLIQNAVDFAYSEVRIICRTQGRNIEVRIEDDGAGYPPDLLTRFGEPFVSSRTRSKIGETGYEGMGLGIFIAKTLLERRGVDLAFFNRSRRGSRPGGATAQIIWRSEIEDGEKPL